MTVSLPSSGLTASLDVRLVEDASLEPPKLVLYNDPGSSASITILGGSGYFKLSAPHDDAPAKTQLLTGGTPDGSPGSRKIHHNQQHEQVLSATMTTTPSNAIIDVTAVRDGSFTITVEDLCLTPSSPPPKALIRVASMASVEVRVSELVEEGGSVEAVVVLLDSSGAPLPIHPTLMRHSLEAPEQDLGSIVSLAFDHMTTEGEAVYKVSGLKVGDTSLRGSVNTAAGGGSKKAPAPLLSRPAPLQVFPPLRLQPASVTLVVGAVYQVSC